MKRPGPPPPEFRPGDRVVAVRGTFGVAWQGVPLEAGQTGVVVTAEPGFITVVTDGAGDRVEWDATRWRRLP